MHDAPLLVLCTVPDEATAIRLARGLVEGRHAACVNVIAGVRSFYRWDDAIQDDAELQLLIKTRRLKLEALRAWLVGEHPYDVPEVIALPIEGGHSAYLDWIVAET